MLVTYKIESDAVVTIKKIQNQIAAEQRSLRNQQSEMDEIYGNE